MNDRPRILFITERFPPDIGGLARSSARIAGALGRLAVDVHVLAWTRQLPAGVVREISMPPCHRARAV